MANPVDNFDLRGAFTYLVEDEDEGGMGLTRTQAENQIAMRLATEANFDYSGATEAGFNNEQIISKLTGIEKEGFFSTVGEGAARGALGAVIPAKALTAGIAPGAKIGETVGRLAGSRFGPAAGAGGAAAGKLVGAAVGGLAASVTAAIADSYLGLSKTVGDYFLGEEEAVLPSDQPYREAGKTAGAFTAYSAALRKPLQKIAAGATPIAGGGTLYPKSSTTFSADFGSRKILGNLSKYDRRPGALKTPPAVAGAEAQVPLGVRALQGTERAAAVMATRARGGARDYLIPEVSTAIGAGTLSGVAEQIDPGDPVTSFFATLGGALLTGIMPGTRLVTEGVMKAARPVQTVKEIKNVFTNKTAQYQQNALLDMYNTALKDLEKSGVNIDPAKFNGAFAVALATAAQKEFGGLVKGAEGFLTLGTTPMDFSQPETAAYLPLLMLERQAMNNKELATEISVANQSLVAYGVQFLEEAYKLGGTEGLAGVPDEFKIKWIKDHTQGLVKSYENTIGEIYVNALKTKTETIEKALAKNVITPDRASELTVDALNALNDISRKTESLLYESKNINYKAEVKPENFFDQYNKFKADELKGSFDPSKIDNPELRSLINEFVPTTILRKPMGTKVPPMLREIKDTEKGFKGLQSLVMNIDPKMRGIEELNNAMGTFKTGKLPSVRLKKGGIKDIEEIYALAVEKGFYPERAYNPDAVDEGMPFDFLDDIAANKFKPDDLSEIRNRQRQNDMAEEAYRILDSKKVNPLGMTDEQVVAQINLIQNYNKKGKPPNLGLVEVTSAVRPMEVKDAIKIRRLSGELQSSLYKADKERDQRRVLRGLSNALLKDLEGPALGETGAAFAQANAWAKARNKVFSVATSGKLAEKLKYEGSNVFLGKQFKTPDPAAVSNQVESIQKAGAFFRDQYEFIKTSKDQDVINYANSVFPKTEELSLSIENALVQTIRGMMLDKVIVSQPVRSKLPPDMGGKKFFGREFDETQEFVDEKKLATFEKKHEIIFRNNPILKDLVSELGDARTAQETLNFYKKDSVGFQQRLEHKELLNSVIKSDSAVNAFLIALEGNTPQKDLSTLLRNVSLLKNSNQAVTNPVTGEKIKGKRLFEGAKEGVINTVIQLAELKSRNLSQSIYEAGGKEIRYYDATIFKDILFDTGKIFPTNLNQPPIMKMLLDRKIVDKKQYEHIEKIVTQLERSQIQFKFMQQASPMEENAPGFFAEKAAAILGVQVGARVGRALGQSSIQIPAIGAQIMRKLTLGNPNTEFVTNMNTLFYPGKFAELQKKLNEVTPETMAARALETEKKSGILNRLRPSNIAGTLTQELRKSPAPYIAGVEAMNEDRPEKRQITPPPQPISQASPSVNPMQTNQRARYAAMFPLDPASSLIRERQAQGIGSLPKP